MLHLGGHGTKRLAVLIGLTAAIFGPTQAECRWVLVNGHQHELCENASDLSVLPPLPDLPLLPTLRKRCRGSTLRDVMKIGPPVVLHKGRQRDGSGVGI